jgi:hypothetical protein
LELPPEIIKSIIKPGSVFYFPDEALTSAEPHYFIVLNQNPLTDSVLILVVSSSQIIKVKHRRKNLPGTCLEIEPRQYGGFTKPSIVDCNTIFKRSLTELIDKLKINRLRLKPEMDMLIIERLRGAVLKSSLIAEEIKKMLR